MALPRIIPVLLLDDRGFVKTERFKGRRYIGDPINTVRIFNSLEADELMIFDIGASRRKSGPDYEFLSDLVSECFMPIGYGGAVQNPEQIGKLIYCGIEKIAINSALLQKPELLRNAVKEYGTSTIIAAMDIKKDLFGRYKVYDHVHRRTTSLSPISHAEQMEALGAGELLITNVDRDGTLRGYDHGIIREISDRIHIPIVATGGCSSLKDMKALMDGTNTNAAGAGSMFVYQGKHRAILISYPNKKDILETFGSYS